LSFIFSFSGSSFVQKKSFPFLRKLLLCDPAGISRIRYALRDKLLIPATYAINKNGLFKKKLPVKESFQL